LLDEFVSKTVTNPFTRTEIRVRTRIPDIQPEAAPDAVEDADFRHLPWIDQKGMSSLDLMHLARALLDWAPDDASSEIHGRTFQGPPSTEVVVLEVPPIFVERLAALSPAEYATYGARWAARFREDAATILDEHTRDRELARHDSEWVARVSEIAGLAKQATASRRAMYMWSSP
jgi:hypothetical protein